MINAAMTLVEDSSEVEENGQGGGGAIISSEREGLENKTSAVRLRAGTAETFKYGLHQATDKKRKNKNAELIITYMRHETKITKALRIRK